MYRRAMSVRLSRGRSTPALRATSRSPLALALLVPWIVRADHEHAAAAPDDLAPVAHLLHARPNLHLLTCTCRRCALAAGRTARAPPAPGPPGGFGCSASASFPRCGPTPCVRCPARPGTSRWAG